MSMGGGPSIPERDLKGELGEIFKSGWPLERKAYRKWWQSEPLLREAHDYALGNLRNVGELEGPLKDRLGSLLDIAPTLKETFGTQIAPVLTSGGALTAEQEADVRNKTISEFAARGMGTTNQSLVADFLNRDSARQSRFGNYLDMANRLLGLQGSDVGTRVGLTSGIQGVQRGALDPALETEKTQVGTFSKLIDPLLAYAGDLFSSNQNAAADEATAGANKSSGVAGGALSAVGSIAPALLAFSDKRVKKKVKKLGIKTRSGIPLSSYEFKSRPGVKIIGPMADEVEKIRPDAVHTDRLSGLKLVDFSKIDAPAPIEIPTLNPKKYLAPVKRAA